MNYFYKLIFMTIFLFQFNFVNAHEGHGGHGGHHGHHGHHHFHHHHNHHPWWHHEHNPEGRWHHFWHRFWHPGWHHPWHDWYWYGDSSWGNNYPGFYYDPNFYWNVDGLPSIEYEFDVEPGLEYPELAPAPSNTPVVPRSNHSAPTSPPMNH